MTQLALDPADPAEPELSAALPGAAAVAPPTAYGDILAGPLHKPLLRLALPMLGAYLFQIGFNWVDTLMVARLGAQSLAGVGSAMFVTWSMVSLIEFASVGVTALVARHVGARRPQEAGAVVLTGLSLGLLGSLLLAAASPWIVAAIVGLMDLEPATASLARDYLQVLFLGYPTLALFFVLEGAYRGAGETRLPMVVLAGSFVLNAVLDLVLIFGLGPVPALGVAGAAAASVAARAAGCLVLGLVLYERHRVLGLEWPAAAALRERLARAWRIVRIGAPAGTAGFSFCAIYFGLVYVANRIGGTTAIASLALGIRVETLTYFVCVALGRAAGTIAGQNLGAGNVPRAHQAARRAVWIGMAAMLPFIVVLLLWGPALVGLFIDDPAVIEAGGAYLRIVSLAFLPMVLEVVFDNLASGVGDTVPAMAIEAVGTFLRLPLAVLLAWWGLGVYAVWWAIAATMLLKGGAFEVWFRSGRWKRTSDL